MNSLLCLLLSCIMPCLTHHISSISLSSLSLSLSPLSHSHTHTHLCAQVFSWTAWSLCELVSRMVVDGGVCALCGNIPYEHRLCWVLWPPGCLRVQVREVWGTTSNMSLMRLWDDVMGLWDDVMGLWWDCDGIVMGLWWDCDVWWDCDGMWCNLICYHNKQPVFLFFLCIAWLSVCWASSSHGLFKPTTVCLGRPLSRLVSFVIFSSSHAHDISWWSLSCPFHYELFLITFSL
jgi:hypothetical protein